MHFPKMLLAASVLLVTLVCGTAVRAEMDTAYIVANEATFTAVEGLRNYFTDNGHDVVRVDPEDMSQVKNAECFIVIGAPKDGDAVSAYLAKILSPEQIKNARKMGGAKLVTTKAGSSNVMIFASDYSLKTFVKGSATQWKEIFEDWYGIPMTITQIIGY